MVKAKSQDGSLESGISHRYEEAEAIGIQPYFWKRPEDNPVRQKSQLF